MYESHFALRQRPFPAVPDSRTYFPSASHELALTNLARGLETGEGPDGRLLRLVDVDADGALVVVAGQHHHGLEGVKAFLRDLHGTSIMP
jgi:hypothetical protein